VGGLDGHDNDSFFVDLPAERALGLAWSSIRECSRVLDGDITSPAETVAALEDELRVTSTADATNRSLDDVGRSSDVDLRLYIAEPGDEELTAFLQVISGDGPHITRECHCFELEGFEVPSQPASSVVDLCELLSLVNDLLLQRAVGHLRLSKRRMKKNECK
jgi:hypothetical protein